MNKFTTIAAMCLFGLMASAVQADEMASDDGMMDDDMKGAMAHEDMKKDDMSDSMGDGMKDNMSGDDMGMKDDGMGMKDDKTMHDDMKDGMKGDGMGKSDSMN
ncbi:hypothetical protein [uncultured Marinobacter sp.]|uniref:hypothetical protein n=1 Tax=uncultured Marinobacter sp. TaxID=187379 RepID=UPI00261ECDF6|nr:hypothetical protein [uncultured Marinobacter sp.]